MKAISRKNNNIYLIVSIAIILLSHFVTFPGWSQDNTTILLTFLGTLILWITTDIVWPSMLCLLSLAMIPAVGFKTALAYSLGNETFAFLLFTFMCTYEVSQTSFVHRVALSMVTSRLARQGVWQMAIVFLATVLLMGLFISPTVLFFIFYPILQEIFGILQLKKGDKFAVMLMTGLVFACNISSGMTPIGHAFPVLAMNIYNQMSNVPITYPQYMGMAVPIGFLLFILMMLIFRFIMNPNIPKFDGISKQDFKNKDSGNLNVRELSILIIFAIVVLLWIVPSLLGNIFPKFSLNMSNYGNAMPPLLGVVLMSIIRIDKKPLMNITEALTKGVSWPSLVMSFATLLIGSCMTDKNIGFIKQSSQFITPMIHGLKSWSLILIFIIIALICSNLMSHLVTSQLVPSLAIPIALASGGAINAGAIVAVIGLAASIGSASPSSMPFTAVAVSTGWADTKNLMKYGIIFTLGIAIILYFLAYPLAKLIIS